MEKASRRLAQRVRIPGFRPGKAPRQIVERTLGRPALIQEALELLLPDVYSEVIAEQKIDAIGQPAFDLKSMEPLVVSATVPVRPTVDLKDYSALRVPRTEVTVAQEQIEEAITNLRRRFATLDPVDRAPQLLFARHLGKTEERRGIVSCMQNYRYKQDMFGVITNIPHKDNVFDHGADALRMHQVMVHSRHSTAYTLSRKHL